MVDDKKWSAAIVTCNLNARSYDVISCTELLSNLLILKLSLWFQHSNAKELYDTNRIS